MSENDNYVIVKRTGLGDHEWRFQVEPYTSLWELVSSVEFLQQTRLNPNKLTFRVNDESVDTDYLLLAGDVVRYDFMHEKAAYEPRAVFEILKRRVGPLKLLRRGKEDQWETHDGKRVTFPRYSRELPPRTLKSIIRQAGLEMGIREFLNQ